MTSAVRSPLRPATRWMRVVSMASAKVIAGRMVVSWRASLDFPIVSGPRRRTLWSEHPQLLYLQRSYDRGGRQELLSWGGVALEAFVTGNLHLGPWRTLGP
jgi:hypothetical protein